MKKKIPVVGAVVVVDGRVLCVQRGPHGALPGMWEFPGGKIEPGESAEEALRREIEEELGCRIWVDREVTTTAHEYDFGVVTLTTFFCELLSGEIQLTEHSQLEWRSPTDLRSLDWAPADIPALAVIEQVLSA